VDQWLQLHLQIRLDLGVQWHQLHQEIPVDQLRL